MIARLRARHEQALAGFLVASLELCVATAMVKIGVVALDGTNVAGNAADKASRTCDKLEAEVGEILRQAAEEPNCATEPKGSRALDALAAYDPRLNE
jgi:hypothetical protein